MSFAALKLLINNMTCLFLLFQNAGYTVRHITFSEFKLVKQHNHNSFADLSNWIQGTISKWVQWQPSISFQCLQLRYLFYVSAVLYRKKTAISYQKIRIF